MCGQRCQPRRELSRSQKVPCVLTTLLLCTRLCPERMLTPKDPGGIAKVPRAFVGPTVPVRRSPARQPHLSAGTHSPSSGSQAHALLLPQKAFAGPLPDPTSTVPPLSPKHFAVQGQPFVPRALST